MEMGQEVKSRTEICSKNDSAIHSKIYIIILYLYIHIHTHIYIYTYMYIYINLHGHGHTASDIDHCIIVYSRVSTMSISLATCFERTVRI